VGYLATCPPGAGLCLFPGILGPPGGEGAPQGSSLPLGFLWCYLRLEYLSVAHPVFMGCPHPQAGNLRRGLPLTQPLSWPRHR
jgi:hypothetical protein